ncbi:hypothetical protein ACIQ6V_31145 [Streptomyces sp. NPDC096198]|uniref:hypothetical protein n=1 Tax=Streptomyces sp. NPDC096198 TaxID=3366080 RepID=UPI00381F8345
MGIESDQLVFDYLSRVGDVAQQRQLPSATRMRLVSGLREEIDRRRAKSPVDSPAAVRRILDRLGTPDEVVAAASADPAADGPPSRPAAVPAQRTNGFEDRAPRRGLRRAVPRPRTAEPEPGPAAGAASPPHLAGAHELGDSAVRPDWWRVEDGPGGGFALGDAVPGFTGGVEIPELLKPPPPPDALTKPGPPAGAPGAEGKPGAEPAAEAVPATAERTRRRRLPLPRLGARSNPLLLLAAGLLLVGAALGNWLALGLGWLIAWASRRLTPAESKWAVMVLPGLAAAAGLVWLWGRTSGRWGDPIAQGHMNDAVAQTWPWVVRGAAVASALYLVWRSQRQK